MEGKRENPLTDRHARQHTVDEPGGCVRHSPTAAGWAEASSLAREGDEPVVSTCVAMDAQKSMGEHPTLEIRTDLSLDEPGDGCALPSRPSQERFDLPANDFVKQGLFGFAAFVLD